MGNCKKCGKPLQPLEWAEDEYGNRWRHGFCPSGCDDITPEGHPVKVFPFRPYQHAGEIRKAKNILARRLKEDKK